MSHEEELTKWLSRKERTFKESLNFAIKAWKSVELGFDKKYETILKWFCKKLNKEYRKNVDNVDWDLIEEFLKLNCFTGLVDVCVRGDVPEVFVETANIFKDKDEHKSNRRIVEIIYLVLESPLTQSGFFSEPVSYCKLMDALLSSYICYIQSLDKLLPTYEGEFVAKVLNHLKYFISRQEDAEKFRKVFKDLGLKSLVELVILLKSKKLYYFEELLHIERMLFLADEKYILHDDFLTLPTHVVLQNFECAFVHFRGLSDFFEQFVHTIFKDNNAFFERSSAGLRLTVIAHVLNLFRKHDISPNTALPVIGKKIEEYVDLYHKRYLPEVLNLLCSTLKLNPLILQQNIFAIVTKLLVVRKTEESWGSYQEFLVLLMEMFRKLRKGEKLVLNLLKAVEGFLKENKISKKLKRKLRESSGEYAEKKLKIDDLDNSEIGISHVEEEYKNIYLQMQLDEFRELKPPSTPDERLAKNRSWPNIYYAWPAHSVGVSFSKFISNLMSKPSLVIWKTLIYTLSECFSSIDLSAPEGNILFFIDFNTALLCQYLAGSRLAEQSDKYWAEIDDNRNFTCELLKKIGKTLLKFEHSDRTMNAFLELSYYLGYFDLVRWYYCPDSISLEDINISHRSKNIYEYLSRDEWTLIEQRIVNFGKTDCKASMNRLSLQRLKARILFTRKRDKQIDIQKYLLSSTLTDVEQSNAIFNDVSNHWLIKYLTKEQIIQVCNIYLMNLSSTDSKLIRNFCESHELLELFAINLYKYIAPFIQSKKSILGSVNFDELLSVSEDDRISIVVKAFTEKTESYTIKKYSPENIESLLKLISTLPLSFTKESTKTVIFALNLGLYRDLLATNDKNLIKISFDIALDVLHYGKPVNTFKYFDLETFLSIFLPTKTPEFYELIFGSFKRMVDDAEKYLAKLIDILKAEQDNELSDDYLTLCMILMRSLSQQMFVRNFKKCQDEIIRIYAKYVNNYFSKDLQNPDEDKKFVEKTLPAYATYISSFLGKAIINAEEVDEQFRKICKIYIGYSINCQNIYSIKLINAVLQHRALLHFDQDEIDFVLQKYWDQLLIEVQSKSEDTKNLRAVTQLVVNFKSEGDFLRILSKIEKDVNIDTIEWICKMLSFISESQLNATKGPIFNNYFKRITFGIILRLKKNANNQYEDMDIILNLLNCQKSLCENPKIPVSVDLVDNILSFLITINIKKFIIADTNTEEFFNLYEKMTEVCSALMRFRVLLTTDRVPQFMHIFKDLLQSICWYKCDRQKDASLETDELDKLAEMAHKLENLMHVIAHHSLDVKRVAPYVLTFTISLMVTNPRPTTLYPKIKTHIENICYDLIAICDHRVGNFILRCSNDAMKQIYETLCKEYKKYHKFKGKV